MQDTIVIFLGFLIDGTFYYKEDHIRKMDIYRLSFDNYEYYRVINKDRQIIEPHYLIRISGEQPFVVTKKTITKYRVKKEKFLQKEEERKELFEDYKNSDNYRKSYYFSTIYEQKNDAHFEKLKSFLNKNKIECHIKHGEKGRNRNVKTFTKKCIYR